MRITVRLVALLIALQIVVARLTAQTEALDPDALLDGLTAAQREAAQATDRRLVVTGGRRSGKTETIVARLCLCAARGRSALYISLTRRLAKKTIWKRLKRRMRASGLPHRVNESELSIYVDGGGSIELGGADDSEAIERYRGPEYHEAIVDECGAMPDRLLRSLVLDILGPPLRDHGGTLVLLGTPGHVLEGYWYEQSGPERVSKCPRWEWTIHHNPLYAGRADEELEAIREENAWDERSPSYQREWLGKWVQDEGVLVYPYSRARNGIDRLPDVSETGVPLAYDGWRYVIGIDVGTSEGSTTLVVWAAHRQLRDDYLVHAEAHTGMLIDHLADRIRLLRRRYRNAQVVLDAGGMGAQHAHELRDRFALPIEAAEKTHKSSAIRVLRDRLVAGRVKVLNLRSLDGLRTEWGRLGWDDDHLQHHPDQADHYSDAALYGLRALRNWRFDAGKPPDPPPDSPEAMDEWLRKDAEIHGAKSPAGRRSRRFLAWLVDATDTNIACANDTNRVDVDRAERAQRVAA